ncbi:MAG: DUF2924 domain-containing protein [Rudaea sp.]|nr:DUF2924 domain-containing protein [Rudaea sp.]
MSRRNTVSVSFPEKLSTRELRDLWRRQFGNSPPARLPAEFLIRLLAQSLQERAAGGLPKPLERQLVSSLNGEPSSVAQSSTSLRLGTRLVRGWGGASHEVTVIDRGFAYRGKAYRSLSEIARQITGARWSGPRFFGLRTPEGRP